MTDLTDKWKKGEIPEGFYYVNDGAEVTIDYYLCDYWERHFDSDIQKVLDKVPSYDEWDKLNNACHELEKETACLTVDIVKLKELLKEVLRHELSLKEVTELTRKISQVLGEE